VLLRARISAGLTKSASKSSRRERLRGVFARFVPEHVVDEVRSGPTTISAWVGLATSGVRFIDLRGFTSLGESTAPQRVIELLNEYFREISTRSLEREALSSASAATASRRLQRTIPTDDHADRSVAAAREMLEVRLPRFNRWLREHGLGDGFAMGIGLNGGYFMWGDVGSPPQLECATRALMEANAEPAVGTLACSRIRPQPTSGALRSRLTCRSRLAIEVGPAILHGRVCVPRQHRQEEDAAAALGSRTSWSSSAGTARSSVQIYPTG
jgi:class 3 adenylate cyclase